jgi:4-hydroxybenzoate polyprenyltransferase
MNAIFCAVSFGVAVGFAATVCRSIKKHPWEYEAEDAMILGVFTLACGLCVVFIGLWGYRLSENDEWWKTNYIFFTGRVFAAAGFTLMMTAVHAVNGQLPRGAYIRVGWLVGGAIMFALIMISLGFS